MECLPRMVPLGPRAQPGLCTHRPPHTLADWLCDLALVQEMLYQLNKESTRLTVNTGQRTLESLSHLCPICSEESGTNGPRRVANTGLSFSLQRPLLSGSCPRGQGHPLDAVHQLCHPSGPCLIFSTLSFPRDGVRCGRKERKPHGR